MKIPNFRACTAVALMSIALICFVYADYNCTGKCVTGYGKCLDYCWANNQTAASYKKCLDRCDTYWHNGKNPQSSQIGLGDPTNPPQKIGPGRVKNPPTSVGGLPNPTPGKGPQEGDHPVKSNPTPTPKPGKGRGGISGLPKSSPTPTPSTR